jgi:plastocyanin
MISHLRSALVIAATLAIVGCSGSTGGSPTSASGPVSTSSASASPGSASVAPSEASASPDGATGSPASASPSAVVATATPAESQTVDPAGGCAPIAKGVRSEKVLDFEFDPKKIMIRSGESVEFINLGATTHRPALDDGSCTTAPMEPGSFASLAFSKAGTYQIICSIHPAMKLTLVVL